MRETGATILLHPRKREVDARGNASRGVDVSVFDPERIALDADIWISCCHFAAESPMRGRSAVLQQPRLGEQKSADTYGTQPAHFCRHLLQPGRERCVAYRSTAQSANQQHRITSAFDSVEMILGHEGQDAALALDGQDVCVRDDLNRVNLPVRKAVN